MFFKNIFGKNTKITQIQQKCAIFLMKIVHFKITNNRRYKKNSVTLQIISKNKNRKI